MFPYNREITRKMKSLKTVSMATSGPIQVCVLYSRTHEMIKHYVFSKGNIMDVCHEQM